MAIHQLKILPEYYQEVLSGNKAYELRKNDRDYKRNDKLGLNEYDGENYTGRKIIAYITYIFTGGKYGLSKDYCILSIRIIEVVKKSKNNQIHKTTSRNLN